MSKLVNIPMDEGRRTLFTFSILISIFSHLYVIYAINTISTTIATALDGWLLYSLMFSLGVIVQAVVTPLTERLGEIFTKPRCIIAGAWLVVVQDLGIILAPNIYLFLAARAVGGFGAALLMVVGIGIFADLFPAGERAKYTGLYGSFSALGGIVAPVLTGLVCDKYDWRLSFAAALVLGIVSASAITMVAPKTFRSNVKSKTDTKGVLFLTVAIVSLTCLLSFGGIYFEWVSLIALALVALVVFFSALFIQTERRMKDGAIVPLILFKEHPFVFAVIGGFLTTMTLMIYSFYVPAFVQDIMLKSATVAGLAFSLPSIVGLVGATLAGVYLSKRARYRLVTCIGTSALALSCLCLAFMDSNTYTVVLLLAMSATFGIGMSICSFVYLSIVQVLMPSRYVGIATAVVMLAISLGGALGVSLAGIIPTVVASPAAAYTGIFVLGALLSAVNLLCIPLLPATRQERRELDTVERP